MNVFNKLMASSFVSNLLIVMSGTAIAQIFAFSISPIISRLYSPSDFGVFGSFNSVLSIIAAGVTLDYSQAIMLPKQKSDAFKLFLLSCVSTSIISFFSLAVCVLAPVQIQILMKTTNVWILFMLILSVLMVGINQSCQAWCVRVKSFKDTSFSQLSRSLTSNGVQLGLGYLKGGALALIVATILGEVIATMNLARVMFRDLKELRIDSNWKRMWHLAKEYRDFPLYSASMSVANQLSQDLPIFLLAHFYGIEMAGAYAFGLRILSTPMLFLLRALRQVLYQKASETHYNGGHLLDLFMKITAGLFFVALLPSLLLVIWAPQLFSWIFGSQWQMAGELARSLVLWMLFMFCNVPAVLFARILRLQQKLFLYDLVLLALRVSVLVYGGMYLSVTNTVMLFSVVGSIMNINFIIIIGLALARGEGYSGLSAILSNLKN